MMSNVKIDGKSILQFVGVPMALSVLLRGFSPGTAAWLPLTPGPPS